MRSTQGAYAIASAAFLVLFVGWIRGEWLGPHATRVFVDLTSTLIPLGVGAFAIRDARRRPEPWRRAWTFLGAAAVAWGLGNAAWTYYELLAHQEVPFPSLADAGYLLVLPLAGLALLLLMPGERRAGLPLRALLDGLLIAAATLFLARALFLRSLFAYAAQQPTELAHAVALAYPVGDLVLLALAILAIGRVHPSARPRLYLLGAAFIALAYADIGFWYLTARDQYVTGSWTDAGWVASFLLVGYATLLPAPEEAPVREKASLANAMVPLVPFALATGASVYVELREGSLEPFLYWVAVVVIGLLMVRQFLSVRENIALRRQREESLSLLESTLESTTDGILVVGTDGRIKHHNRQFAQMWRVPPDVLAAGNDDRVLHSVLKQLRQPADFLAKVEDLYAHPNASSLDILEFEDGRVFERYSRPQYDDARQVVGRVWSFRDVTEHRRLQDARVKQVVQNEQHKRIHETDRFKTQFLNMAAHELNTPLMPIALQSTLLLEGKVGPMDDKVRRSVSIISRNVKRIGELVTEILEVARLQSEGLRFHYTTFPLRAAIEEAVDSFADGAAALGVEVQVEGAADLSVETDRNRFIQIVTQLLSNGLKFTPRNGRVTVAVRPAGQLVEVSVKDTGIGLDEAQRALLFQPFSQVHDTMQVTAAGTGLGLYIARGLAEALGGTLVCHSEGLGKGSEFLLSLPFKREGTAGVTVPARLVAPKNDFEARLRALI